MWKSVFFICFGKEVFCYYYQLINYSSKWHHEMYIYCKNVTNTEFSVLNFAIWKIMEYILRIFIIQIFYLFVAYSIKTHTKTIINCGYYNYCIKHSRTEWTSSILFVSSSVRLNNWKLVIFIFKNYAYKFIFSSFII